MKKCVYVAVLGLGLILSSVAHAAENTHEITEVMIDSAPEERLKRVLQQLDLMKAQKKILSAFLRPLEPNFAENIEEYSDNAHVLDGLSGAHYDVKKIAKLAEKQGDLVADTIKMRMEVRHEVYSILTLEQRIQLEQIMKANPNQAPQK